MKISHFLKKMTSNRIIDVNLYFIVSYKGWMEHKSDDCLLLLPLANYKPFISSHKKLLNRNI